MRHAGFKKVSFPARLAPAVKGIVAGRPDYISLWGGRGSAKSVTAARAIVMRCELRPTHVVCIRFSETSTKESSKAELATAIDDVSLEPEKWNVRFHDIVHENGSRLIFRGIRAHTIGNLRSISGKYQIAFIEEAQFVEEAALRDFLPSFRPREGGTLLLVSNPLDPEGCVYRDFCDPAKLAYPEQTLSIQQNWDHNPFFPERLRALKDRAYAVDKEMADWEWGGVPLLNAKANVFKRGRHWVTGNLDAKTENAVPFYGLDFGQGTAPTIVVQCFLLPPYGDERRETVYVARENVVEHEEIDADWLDPFVSTVGVREGDVVTADKQALGWRNAPGGWTLKLAYKPPASVDRGVKWLKERRIVVEKECATTIRHLVRYSFRVDRAGVVHPEYVDADNDAVDAIRYAFNKPIFGKAIPEQRKWRVLVNGQ